MKLAYLLFLLPALVAAEDPYFGGTLLSPIPVNIPPGQWYLSTYLYAIRQTGTYSSSHHFQRHPQFTSLQVPWEFETGLTNWLDIALYPTFYYTRSNSRSSYLYGDTKLAFGLQISREQKRSWTPNFRLILQESFPTGHYDHLNPHKHFADVSGSGAYETWLIAVLQKTLLPFTLNLTLNYVIPSSVSVHGYSLYGGNAHTRTTLTPGQQFIGNLGIEYAFTQCWIFAFDFHYQHQNSSSPLQTPSSEQLSIAPCLEYNPYPNLGVEFGSWLTLSGRNASAFTSGVVTVYWTF